jgi:hypothetical protein
MELKGFILSIIFVSCIICKDYYECEGQVYDYVAHGDLEIVGKGYHELTLKTFLTSSYTSSVFCTKHRMKSKDGVLYVHPDESDNWLLFKNDSFVEYHSYSSTEDGDENSSPYDSLFKCWKHDNGSEYFDKIFKSCKNEIVEDY